MAANVTPWQQRPVFLAATNTTVPFGDPLQYDVPRQFPVTDPNDRTSYHPGQRTWSIKDPPDVLYQIYPDQDWYRFMHSGLPGPKIDHYGRAVLESWPPEPFNPRPLLDFPILPDQIGTKEHNIFFEIWRRLDPRVRLVDITMRMNYQRTTDNALNSALQRIRLSYNVLSWHQMWRNIEENKNRDRVIASLPMCAIEANSSRGHTPGLIIPWMGEDGGRIAQPYVKPHTRTRVSHHTVRDEMNRIEPARDQSQAMASRPSLQPMQYVTPMYVRDERQHVQQSAQPPYTASRPSFDTSQHVAPVYELNEMQRIEPTWTQHQNTTSRPSWDTNQDVTHMYDFDSPHGNMFNWDQYAQQSAETVHHDNHQPMANVPPYVPIAQPGFGIRVSDDGNQGMHDEEHQYSIGDYRAMELSNEYNGNDEMGFEIWGEIANEEILHNPEGTEGGLAWTGHEGHSPAFCSQHCYQIPLDSLPAPFASFLEREAP